MFVYLTSNILYSLISSLGFILANLVVDINILRTMKQVIAERDKNTSRAIQSNEVQKKYLFFKIFFYIIFFIYWLFNFWKLRENENKSINRVVLLIVLNATLGIILKSLMAVRPVFTIINQIDYIFMNYGKYEKSFYISRVRTCQSDYVCTTIDTIGKNLILLNLTIPFFFFYKFDTIFKECFKTLTRNMKKKISKN